MPRKQISREHGTVRVTFELPAAAGGEVVHLVGDFTGWEGIPMKRHDNGDWRATLDLAPGGTYEYRYLIDGERWENDWAADRYVRNVFGHENSVVETPALPGGEARRDQDEATAPVGAPRKSAAKPAAKTSGATTKKKTATKKTAAKKTPAKKAATGTARKATAKKASAKTGTARKAPAKTSKGADEARKATRGPGPVDGGSSPDASSDPAANR